MNKLILSLAFAFLSTVVFSQKIYFVYLQSESEQPFYVKLNEKLHSSTASGYLILPKLRDSTYSISLGFPGNTWPEQQFSLAVNKKDHGYLLKNFGDKGWGLFDLQTLNVQMSATTKSTSSVTSPNDNNSVSEFTAILSKAADDPSLKDRPIRPAVVVEETKIVKNQEPVKSEESKVKSEVSTVKTEPATSNTQSAIGKSEESKVKSEVSTVKTEPATSNTQSAIDKNEESKVKSEVSTVKNEPIPEKSEEVYIKSTITRNAESAGDEGHDVVFIDTYPDGKKDTIRVVIPNPKPMVEAVKEQPKEEKKFLDIGVDSAAKQPEVKAEEQKVKSEESVKGEGSKGKIEEKTVRTEPVTSNEQPATSNQQPATTTPSAVTQKETKTPIVNSCSSEADNNDFLKLRRKMVATNNEDDMVTEARKYFKTKCFTVYQVRNLGTLFLTDEGRYNFFDAAYRHTSDVHNFISLQLELKETYYVKRFQAMLK